VEALAIGLDEGGDFSIYADIASSLGTEGGLFNSNDAGGTWSFSRGHGYLLTADPDNPAKIYAHDGSSLFVTDGRDLAWRLVTGSNSKAYSAIHIDHPNGAERLITAATNVASQGSPYVGVFVAQDGGRSWTQRNGGMGSAWTELSIDPTDSARIFLATYYTNAYSPGRLACTLFRSVDRGASWSSIRANATWCGPTFDASHVLYLDDSGRLQQSRNAGDSWLWGWDQGSFNRKTGAEIDPTLAFALPSYYRGGFFFEEDRSLSANPYEGGFVYDAGAVIYYSADGGTSWELSEGSEGLWDARLYYANQGKQIYAMGRSQQSYSVDSGKTWQPCPADVTTSRSDSRLAMDAQGSRLYVATPGTGVLISADACRTWRASNNGLANLYVNTLAVDPNNSDTVYAGTDGGAYISIDSGKSWGEINDGLLGATVVYSIAVDKDGNVYAATPYGIFKLEGK
jgi:photosystem II stability/assembly factor-like uncharacterized protein